MKYTYDEKFFTVWSRDLAYILGFTFADGNIYGCTLSYSLAQKDIKVLQYIRKCVKTESPVKTFRRKRKGGKKFNWVCRLRINSTKIVKILNDKYKLTPHKTKTASIDFDIPEAFRGDFIRGFFDGDGWVYNRRKSVEAGVCGASSKFINDFHALCGHIGNFRYRKPSKHKIASYSIEFYTKSSLKLRELMYQKEPFCLERKKKRFWDFYTPSEKLWTKAQIEYLMKHSNNNAENVAVAIQKSVSAVLNKRFKLGLCKKRHCTKKEAPKTS